MMNLHMGTTPLRPAAIAALICCTSTVLAEEPFYRQLIDLQQPAGYSPTRSFTIVVDGERNRLVASDDPDLQFNLMWLDQFHPDYRHRRGGAAIGQLLRSYLRQLYDDGRQQNSMSAGYVPDGDVDVKVGNFGGEMEYHLRVKDDEVNLRLEYLY